MLYNGFKQGRINYKDYDFHMKNILGVEYRTALVNLIKDYPQSSLLGDEGQKELVARATDDLNREVRLFMSANGGRRPTDVEYAEIVATVLKRARERQSYYDKDAENKEAKADNTQKVKDNVKATTSTAKTSWNEQRKYGANTPNYAESRKGYTK